MSSNAQASESSGAIESTTIPFVPSKLFHAAKWALDTADFYGEKLAFFFGITSPKYSYEINRYNRMLKEEAARKESQANESGWNNNSTNSHMIPINTSTRLANVSSNSVQVYDSLAPFSPPKF